MGGTRQRHLTANEIWNAPIKSADPFIGHRGPVSAPVTGFNFAQFIRFNFKFISNSLCLEMNEK
jgi:hypothetical protein